MKYTVTWTPAAQQDLARVWLSAQDRNAVTVAAYLIDQLLADDPDSRGSLRFDTVRTLSVPPLGVDFDVVADDLLVFVLTVWDSTQAGPP